MVARHGGVDQLDLFAAMGLLPKDSLRDGRIGLVPLHPGTVGLGVPDREASPYTRRFPFVDPWVTESVLVDAHLRLWNPFPRPPQIRVVPHSRRSDMVLHFLGRDGRSSNLFQHHAENKLQSA